jgi:peptidoglycan/LPS O-acetylase OafA/YrhL
LAAAFSTAIAVLSWYLLERPILRLKSRVPFRIRRTAPQPEPAPALAPAP